MPCGLSSLAPTELSTSVSSGLTKTSEMPARGLLTLRLRALSDLTGSPARAQQTLLALLGERLLPAPEQDAPTEERRQHG